MMLTVLAMPFLMAKFGEINFATLGITRYKLKSNFLKGAICGTLLLSTVTFIILLLGAIQIEVNSLKITKLFLIGLFFFIFQGTWEELIYRGYLMPYFSKKFGDITSIILTSILFTLGHALNPGMKILPVINLFIASLVFSVIYYYKGNLILVGVGHGLWNFSQGYIFGAEVSGNIVPSSILKSIPVSGYELISGGSFGFEGGIITTFIGIILILIFILHKNLQEGCDLK